MINTHLLNILPQPDFGKRAPDYDCGGNSEMMLVENATADNYLNYCKQLESNGFCLCSELTLEKCMGKTYKGKGLILQCNFREYEGSVRVIGDKADTLPVFEKPVVNRKNPTELIQFETDHSLIDCGMCYIIRLCDGSFFIIDSAHSHSVNDEKRLHALLRSKTPRGEKIVIAGWFFTHGHDDHIEKAQDYLKTMCSDTVVEMLYYNFPSVSHPDSPHWSAEVCPVQESFCKFVEASDFPRCNIHSMQRFYVRNAEIDVLCTHEDVYPRSLADYNDSSSVITVRTEGNKILFPGDASFTESDILTSSFGEETLHCDICQLSHHGHFGCKPELYKKCGHRLLLIPNTEIKLNEEAEKVPANKTAMEIAQEYFISSEGTVEIQLPYEKGQAKIYPDETTENFEEIFRLWGYEYTDEFKEQVKSDFLSRQ